MKAKFYEEQAAFEAEKEARDLQREKDLFKAQHLFSHISSTTEHELDFIIDGFLPRRYVAILAGDPKAGKTALASAIALAVAEGSPFAGMKSHRAPVLWLSLEETRQERATVMAPVAERLKDTDFYITYSRLRIDDEDDLREISDWVIQLDAGLLVVDPLHAAHSGRSLNDGWNARKTLTPLKRFCDKFNVVALVLHHIGRSNRRVAESAQLAACAGMSLLLTSRQEAEERIVKVRGAGRGEFANRTWHLASSSPFDYRPTTRPRKPVESAPEPHVKLDDVIHDFLSTHQGAYSASEIGAQLQRNPNSIRNALARLTVLERARLVIQEGNTRYYSAVINEPLDETKRNGKCMNA